MSYSVTLGYTPIFQIFKGGVDITSSLSDRIVSIRVSSYEGGGDSDSLDIVLDDRDWHIALPSIGENTTTLDIALGYAQSSLWPMGSFSIDEVNLSFSPKTMSLHGNSVGSNTNLKAPLITSFDNKTVGDVVSTIASAANVSPVVDVAIGNITVGYLNQHSSSGHLLEDFERRFNGMAKISDGKLSFTQRGSGNNASGNSIGSVTLDGSDIADLHVKLTNAGSFGSTKAGYWDKTEHKIQWVTNTVPGDSASVVPFLLKRVFSTQVEAQAAADSQQSAMNRRGVQGSLTMSKGDPSIKGGSTLVIISTRDGIDGSFKVTSATHSFSKDSGITTTLNFVDEDGLGSQDSGGE